MTTLPVDTTENESPYWKRYKPQSQWRSADDEFEATKIGMWLFLSTELLLFSGMLCAYLILRMMYPESFKGASGHYLDWRVGAVNTGVLLLSSFAVAMSVRNAQLNQQMWLRINTFIAIVCGVLFLVLKIWLEYIPKIMKGEIPGGNFSYPHALSDFDQLFLSVYWVATAIHGIHVLAGVILLSWILRRAWKLHFGPSHYTAVENVGLFWHIVDLIWIFLFPLLYLVP